MSAPADGISQAVYPARSDLKSDLLLELLNREAIRSVLVFTRTKHRANRLAKFLQNNGVACERIHGNRTQNQRTDALAGFKHGDFQVLVATDIAARGIDVEALSHVINFDVPDVPESYIHRVGRTARASMTGDAFTFVSADEEAALRDIERALGKRIPRLRLDGFDYNTKRAKTAGGGRSKPSNGHRTQHARAQRAGVPARQPSGQPRQRAPRPKRHLEDRIAAFAIESATPKRPSGGYGRRSQPASRNSRRPARRKH